MYDIHVIISNTPGALAALGTLLGKNGVGLEGGGVFSLAQESHAHFLVEEGETARRVLQDAGFTVHSVTRPLIRKLSQARPGELGEIARALADGGVNILVQYSDHANRLILVTDNPEQAEKVTRPWAIPDNTP
ncbi:amino acid-binding protein [Cronobacter malonaticus]|uniref:amino acid-binding protein n=1 Tax=Cronobacter malonaticus TaxID=413503 RepID=UPI0005198CBA|nr:amino acid-binding protein [Cronobacter malonaticus]EGT4373406.1 amino acid-binding protein [Cronobacter malonaticus]ELY6230732.1 amino acid-binding protein [Cronobacter malonaticus]MDI6467183.1 amino acid-binding protein [Cronobacter malonaticus]MDK1177961.1 amino acid-binding protein [Cronobacter malonaticus]MDK1685447.1 amino acid-binding protein [Cronobacter malonaticus]